MRTTLLPAAAGFVLLGVACSAPPAPGDDAPVRAVRSAIVDGLVSQSDDDAVVYINTSNGTLGIQSCSGTLLAPNIVMTARHCVSQVEEMTTCNSAGVSPQGGGVLKDYPADELHIYLGADASAVAATDPYGTLEAARGKQVITDGATVICNADVAMIILDRAVQGTYAPLHFAMPVAHEFLTAVGYGEDATGKLTPVRMKRTMTLEGIGPLTIDSTNGIADDEIELNGGICNGDSGSPLFNETHAVIAVASRVSSCTGDAAFDIYEAVAMRQAFIQQAFDATGQTMWIDGQPSPYGGDSTDAAPVATVTKHGGCSAAPGAPSPSSSWLSAVPALGLAIAAFSRRSSSRAAREESNTTYPNAARRTSRS